MTPLFTKMNVGVHRRLLIVNAPATFEPEIEALQECTILREPGQTQDLGFLLIFVEKPEDVTLWTTRLLNHAPGDPVLWFAYPKGITGAALNRDRGWDALVAEGFSAVRQVSIDSRWSALRFRRSRKNHPA